MKELLRVENLCVFAGDTPLVEPVSFSLKAGERLTLLGQTGSGKSLLMQAIMGTLPKELRSQGLMEVAGQVFNLGAMTASMHKARVKLWGVQVSALPQEPWTALDPLMPAQTQLSETLRWVGGYGGKDAHSEAAARLTRLGLKGAEGKRVDQLSGGMAQRVAIACAMAGGASILLADEPTKGLDVSRRDQVISDLREQTQDGVLITITHDVDVARQLPGRMMVIQQGCVLETGDVESIINAPQHPFTQALIDASPASWIKEARDTVDTSPVLSVKDLTIARGGKPLQRDLNFEVHAGEVLGVVGDSGCGKSTLGDTLLGMLTPESGRIERHVTAASHQWLKLYQDPVASVPSSVSLRTLLDDVLRRHAIAPDDVPPLMQQLELTEEVLTRTADGVSGGELQRFCMLRALLMKPVCLFADEPTSRLDPITAKKVSAMLVSAAQKQRCAVILVSHDPDLIDHRCDRVIRLSAL